MLSIPQVYTKVKKEKENIPKTLATVVYSEQGTMKGKCIWTEIREESKF